MSDHLPAISRSPSGGVSGASWCVRWLLVFVLAFDHLSAPFHHHHHDGVVGQLEFAAARASVDDGATHAEGVEHPFGSHAAMAIRVDPSRLGQLPAADGTDAKAARVSVLRLFSPFNAPPPILWQPDRSRPDFRSHRSLPPASRAPPFHA